MSFFSDSISNTVSAINVANISNSRYINLFCTRRTLDFIQVLNRLGIVTIESLSRAGGKLRVCLMLIFDNQRACFSKIRIISKPSKRYFIDVRTLNRFLIGRSGFLILETSCGFVTSTEAASLLVGGTVIAWVQL
jgi:ribosomal protein S8